MLTCFWYTNTRQGNSEKGAHKFYCRQGGHGDNRALWALVRVWPVDGGKSWPSFSGQYCRVTVLGHSWPGPLTGGAADLDLEGGSREQRWTSSWSSPPSVSRDPILWLGFCGFSCQATGSVNFQRQVCLASYRQIRLSRHRGLINQVHGVFGWLLPRLSLPCVMVATLSASW